MTNTIASTQSNTTTELDRELEQLQEAAIWQLNAALEAGWDEAADGISDSYAADVRLLRRRWFRLAA